MFSLDNVITLYFIKMIINLPVAYSHKFFV